MSLAALYRTLVTFTQGGYSEGLLDSIDWSFLLEVLEFMGFSRRWTELIAALLSTASTRILINGRAGRRICHLPRKGAASERSIVTHAFRHCHWLVQDCLAHGIGMQPNGLWWTGHS